MTKKLWVVSLIAALVLVAGGCQSLAYREAPVEAGAIYPSPQEGYVSPGGADYSYRPQEPTGAETVERMVIRTADLELIVPDTEAAIAAIEDLANDLGGYVVSLNTYQYEQGVQGSMTIRIPAESFGAALAQIKALATTVRRESIGGQDVTDEYVDLESRLRHLRAVEEQLLGFLEDAEDTEATLAVYAQLQQVQGEIEQVTGRMQYLENQVALATITISLTPDALAQPLEVGGWNLPGTVRNAVEALLNTVEFVVKAAIYLVIVVLPTLIILLAPIVGIVFLVRWLMRRRRRARTKAE